MSTMRAGSGQRRVGPTSAQGICWCLCVRVREGGGDQLLVVAAGPPSRTRTKLQAFRTRRLRCSGTLNECNRRALHRRDAHAQRKSWLHEPRRAATDGAHLVHGPAPPRQSCAQPHATPSPGVCSGLSGMESPKERVGSCIWLPQLAGALLAPPLERGRADRFGAGLACTSTHGEVPCGCV